jgi:hypothetical protein
MVYHNIFLIKEIEMKNILIVITSLFLFNLSSVSFADQAHPCKSIETACKAAGFYKGGNGSGKGLYKDCVEPVAEGKTIQGITVSPEDMANCKAKIDTMNK